LSGRTGEFLERQFKGLPVTLASEHGAELRELGEPEWRSLVRYESAGWRENALRILQLYVERVPGSFIEQKRYSVAWHYRLAPRDFGEFQARRLLHELRMGFADSPVGILSGKKVVEVRCLEADKGLFVRWY